jgi:thiol-disulfide isomerase/thioredoxin
MKSLRKSILLVVILLCGRAAFAQPAPEKLSYPVPETTWKSEIKSIDSSAPFSLNDYKGKVILLAVWAYWCKPCINQLNELVKIEKEFAGQNLAVVGISLSYSFDDDRQGAVDYVRQSNFKFRMGWINNDVGSLLMSDLGYVPNFMFINSDGVLVERILGFNPAKTPKLLRQALKPLLKKEG